MFSKNWTTEIILLNWVCWLYCTIFTSIGDSDRIKYWFNNHIEILKSSWFSICVNAMVMLCIQSIFSLKHVRVLFQRVSELLHMHTRGICANMNFINICLIMFIKSFGFVAFLSWTMYFQPGRLDTKLLAQFWICSNIFNNFKSFWLDVLMGLIVRIIFKPGQLCENHANMCFLLLFKILL